jgi:hypothetical protein
VWLFFLIIKAPDGSREEFSWLQLVGFVPIVIGVLVYNEVLELKFLGLDKNLKRNLKKIEMQLPQEERNFINYQEKLIMNELNNDESLDSNGSPKNLGNIEKNKTDGTTEYAPFTISLQNEKNTPEQIQSVKPDAEKHEQVFQSKSEINDKEDTNKKD